MPQQSDCYYIRRQSTNTLQKKVEDTVVGAKARRGADKAKSNFLGDVIQPAANYLIGSHAPRYNLKKIGQQANISYHRSANNLFPEFVHNLMPDKGTCWS